MARELIPVGLRKGDKSADVELLNRYLSRFGYASPTSPDGVDLHSSTAVVTNDFSDETERALRKFQKRHRLAETGETDAGTAALLNMPRCGVPDPDFHSRYVLAGPRWERTNLTFAISQFPGGAITDAQARAALVAAFGAWAAAVVPPLLSAKLLIPNLTT
ncbi:peptidoglycan-binding domain-containing protein [Bradyrhizobium erythrophlei]|uniref:Putative peptidoglycan binding domain-containing protein n=1 Tax=Bradyrhizobium erythrophlei TaxID=1437360 RepID=A0A1M5PV88_9BRAD|nr:Putative peptidoglycan binding domain-containing protein [Bradyrhizobium erythrophlei]